MFQPSDDIHTPPPWDSIPPSPKSPILYDIPTSAGEPSAGPSAEKSVVRLDYVFNFQLVVFQVENTLFQVLRNGFNVPGTTFEGLFALPHTPTDSDGISLEGSNLENPIHLPGIKANHFRSFLRILYPFIDQTPVVEFDEWVGVLNLATMWFFQEIRAKAITRLSELVKQKTVLERISLAREYRVAEWLRDGYLELSRKWPLNFEELRPAEPCSNPLDLNWEADAKKWEMTARSWETLARMCYLQTKAVASINSNGNQYCQQCGIYCGPSYPENFLCQCRLLIMVDELFREELGSLKENLEHVEHPLPSLDSTEVPSGKKKKGKKGKAI